MYTFVVQNKKGVLIRFCKEIEETLLLRYRWNNRCWL